MQIQTRMDRIHRMKEKFLRILILCILSILVNSFVAAGRDKPSPYKCLTVLFRSGGHHFRPQFRAERVAPRGLYLCDAQVDDLCVAGLDD